MVNPYTPEQYALPIADNVGAFEQAASTIQQNLVLQQTFGALRKAVFQTGPELESVRNQQYYLEARKYMAALCSLSEDTLRPLIPDKFVPVFSNVVREIQMKQDVLETIHDVTAGAVSIVPDFFLQHSDNVLSPITFVANAWTVRTHTMKSISRGYLEAKMVENPRLQWFLAMATGVPYPQLRFGIGVHMVAGNDRNYHVIMNRKGSLASPNRFGILPPGAASYNKMFTPNRIREGRDALLFPITRVTGQYHPHMMALLEYFDLPDAAAPIVFLKRFAFAQKTIDRANGNVESTDETVLDIVVELPFHTDEVMETLAAALTMVESELLSAPLMPRYLKRNDIKSPVDLIEHLGKRTKTQHKAR